MAELIIPHSGVYAIRNTTNGKVYVGSAVNIGQRMDRHRRDLCGMRHTSLHLQKAWLLHSEHSFDFVALETVADARDLIASEQAWIDRLQAADPSKGYNLRPAADNNLGCNFSERVSIKGRLSEKQKEALRLGRLSKIGRPLSVGQKEQLRLMNTGKKHSAESREKNRIASTGRVKSTETRAKLSAANKGKVRSPEQVLRIRAMNIGRKASVEARAKMSAWQKQKVFSPEYRARLKAAAIRRGSPSLETRAKLRVANLGKRQPIETRAKISATLKGKKQSAEHIARRFAKLRNRLTDIELLPPPSHTA